MTIDRLKEVKQVLESIKVVKTSSVKIVKGHFLKIGIANYELVNGKKVKREEIIKRKKEAVVILPITTDGKLILVAESRPLTKEGAIIEAPAGYVEAYEQADEAAIREMEEETGYTTSKPLIKIIEHYQDQGCARSLIRSYIAIDCKKTKEPKLDKDEVLIPMAFTFDEVIDLVKLGFIKDNNSLVAIKWGESIIKEYLKEVEDNIPQLVNIKRR